MTILTKCDIRPVGKNRSGTRRYWCIAHRADASTKTGHPAAQCRYAHVEQVETSEVRRLVLSDYPGGVAIWGAVPPVYDTTTLPMERGIHVHARNSSNSEKVIDDSFRKVQLEFDQGGRHYSISIEELDALYFLVSSIFRFEVEQVKCTHCGDSHLDKDWFSVHPHRTHLCAACGRFFVHESITIGNPLARLRKLLPIPSKPKYSKEKLKISQNDFAGGIRIWGTNDAIIWTGPRNEERGVHLHAYGPNGERILDETYGSLEVDGIHLDGTLVNILTAQSAMPTISGSVRSGACTKCDAPLYSEETNAYTPSTKHQCRSCGLENIFLDAFIANPILTLLDELSKKSVRPRQFHDLGLITENLES
jgi:hypothetical protein